jgi:GMP synthase (glutamine-hydrolysing)
MNGKELGWEPVQAASDGSTPPWFETLLNPELRVLHWHRDTFDLPPGARRLAGTALYPNQAFVVENYALALQFHPEVTVQGLERWYVGHAGELAQAGIGVRQLREKTRTFGPELETVARQVWRRWLDHVFNSRLMP